MRHIPEDELHAYLDQALSRSQCVEIERHLARCPRCQWQRDEIAALRDRTTALLARIGPPPIVPPAFETLEARAAERRQRRWRWLTAGAWAASVAGALALGWSVNQVTRPEMAPVAVVPGPDASSAAATAEQPDPVVRPASVAASRPERPAARPAPKPAAPPAPRQLVRAGTPATDSQASEFAQAVETDPQSYYSNASVVEPLIVASAPLELGDLIAQPVGADPGLQGLWRTVVPGRDGTDRASDIAMVPGLPVMQMRVQPGGNGSEVTAVDQLLESGEVIRTISGPAPRVLALVDHDTRFADSTAAESVTPVHERMTVTIRQGDRMVAVTGPSQALGSLLARVNLKSSKRRY